MVWKEWRAIARGMACPIFDGPRIFKYREKVWDGGIGGWIRSWSRGVGVGTWEIGFRRSVSDEKKAYRGCTGDVPGCTGFVLYHDKVCTGVVY